VLAAILPRRIGVAVMLPREAEVRPPVACRTLQQMLRHLRQKQLVATFAVGFGTLFNFVATFTYVSFLLAAPPTAFQRRLGRSSLLCRGCGGGAWTGRLIARFGRRSFMLCLIATGWPAP